MRIYRLNPASTRVCDLEPGDVFQSDCSLHIVTNVAEGSPASWICVNLVSGVSSRFSPDGERVRHLPDATLMPYGPERSES